MKVYKDARKSLFKGHLKNKKDKNGRAKIGVSFENFIYDNSKTLLFRNDYKTHDYIELNYEEIDKITDFEFLFEVLCKGMNRKLFFDYDNKNVLISYNDIDEICSSFVNFLKDFYNINQNIKYCIQGSVNDDFILTDKDDKRFKSFHIIFNVYTKTNLEAKQVITEFKKLKPTLYSDGIDESVYSNMKVIRAIGQRKNEEGRFDKLRVLNKENFVSKGEPLFKKKEILYDYLITAIRSSDILLNVVMKEQIVGGVKTKYNIKYNINQLEQIKRYMENLTYDDLHNYGLIKNRWFNNLNLIIHNLLICGIEWNNIIHHELINLFLQISKNKSTEKEYNNEKSFEKNKILINELCNKKQLRKVYNNKFFTELSEGEQAFIYKILNLECDNQIIISNRTIDNKLYLDINITDEEYDKEKKTELILYDTRKYILLINCDIINIAVKNKNSKYDFLTEKQFHYFLDKIQNLNNDKLNFNTTHKRIDIKAWDETKTNTSQSAYYEGAVGSRKSSERMNKDIVKIIKENNENRILMICDTKTLSRATHTKAILYLDEFKKVEDKIKHYSNFKTPKQINYLTNDNTRILITTYDSLKKYSHLNFTHIIIDEYLNVRKRFLQIEGDNQEKERNLNNFFTIMKNSISIKCYDADLQKGDLEILEECSGKSFKYFRLIDYIQKNNTIIFTEKSKLINSIIQKVQENKPISISSTIRKEADRIFDLLIGIKQNLKIVIMTSQGAKSHASNNWDEELKNDLIKNTELWKEYEVVIYSPTIMTGISFDLENYFDTHYGILCGGEDKTTDFTQTAQMLFRVRKNSTSTIMLCDIQNRITRFYEYFNENETTEYMKRDNFNEISFINKQSQSQLENYILQGENKINNTLLKKYKDLLDIEDERRKQYYYDLFFTLRKWGCNIFKCNYYKNQDEIEFKYKRNEDIDYSKKKFITLDNFEDYLLLDYVDKIKTKNEDNEGINDPNEIKTLILKKLGYGNILFNKLKHEPLFNYITYNVYTNNAEQIKYSRLKILGYYTLKNVIYNIASIVYAGINDLEELFLKQKIIKEQNTFLNWLCNSFILFKLFDLQTDQTYHEILHDIITKTRGQIYIHNKDEFIESLKPLQPIIDLLINKGEIKNNEISTLLEHAFNYIYCINSVIRTPLNEINKIEINYNRIGIPFRFEKQGYYIEHGNHNLSSTDYDDYKNYLNNNDSYKSSYGRIIYEKYLPKIRIFNYYSESKEQAKLFHYIDTYIHIRKRKILKESIKELSIQELEKNIKINSEEAEEIWNKRHEIDLKYLNEEFENTYWNFEEFKLLEGEIFKTTKFQDHKISNYGRILFDTEDDKKIIKPHILEVPINQDRIKEQFNRITPKNDLQIKLKINCVIINNYVYFVERLVAECFLNDYRADYSIKHIDDNYNNDRVENLIMVEEWNSKVYSNLLKEKKEEKKEKTNEKTNEIRKSKIKCELCEKEISYINYKQHIKRCISKENISKA